MLNCLAPFFFGILFASFSFCQVSINEASNANTGEITGINGSFPDWIEFYNSGSIPFSLNGYFLSDDKTNLQKYKFSTFSCSPNDFRSLLLDGSGLTTNIDHFETAIFETDVFRYIIPNATTPSNWKSIAFSDAAWSASSLGIGYGDADDNTLVPSTTTSVYIRKTFTIADTSIMKEALLHMDFDDGFVAYLNGIEIARSNITQATPAWNDFATDHEAVVYQGQNFELITLNIQAFKAASIIGSNVLAIEVHNSSPTSSDLTLRANLSFGVSSPNISFSGTIFSGFFSSSVTTNSANFTLKGSGETVYFSNPSGTIIDSLVIPDLDPGHSVGKQLDGVASTFVFTTATPEASNNASIASLGYENAPSILTAGGLFSSPITVEIVNNSIIGGVIRYTTDGQIPTLSSSIYSSPISVSANANVRAKCFPILPNYLASQLATETYLINVDHSLPIVSLSVDDIDLYGAQGIFDNWFTDWKRPCVVEYYDANGFKQFESKASIKPDGGAGGSRSNPQHSVTIDMSNPLFGEGGEVPFSCWDEKPYVDNVSTFYLRNGSNFWNQYPQKDATFMRVMKDSYVNYQGYTPVVCYLNGAYFGVYEMREKANESYFKENYNNEEDSLDLLSISYFYGPSVIREVKGSDDSFYEAVNFISTYPSGSIDFFEKCDEKLDLKNYTDYIIAENFFGNTDWIYNNVKIARTRSKDLKWRFFLQDLELGLCGWVDQNVDMFSWFQSSNQPNPFYQMQEALMLNANFKNYHINRYADLLNTRFKPSEISTVVNELYNEVLPEFPAHLQRWTGDVAGGMATYSGNRDCLLFQLGQRQEIVRDQMNSYYGLNGKVITTLDVLPAGAGYIQINSIVPETLPWSGTYFNGVPVEISVIANPGFSFDSWEVNGIIPASDLTDSILSINVNSNVTFRALFSGAAIPNPIIVSEINYHPENSQLSEDWLELYNSGTSPLNLSNSRLKAKQPSNDYIFPANTYLNPNQYLVVSENGLAFSQSYPGVSNYVASNSYGLKNSGDTVLFVSALGQEILKFSFDDSLSFPLAADGWGYTFEKKNLDNNYTDSSWFVGCVGGSPGTEFINCNENLLISEFNYNNLTVNNSGDWVEIYNNSSSSINLQNYQLKDSKDSNVYIFPNYNLASGAYVVVGNDSLNFKIIHPTIVNTLFTFPFNLKSSDALRLYNSANQLVTSVRFTPSSFPNLEVNSDKTMEYKLINNLNGSQGEALNWFLGCELGSPGRAYSDCNPNFIEGEEFNLYPNPSNGTFTILLNNPENENVTFFFSDMSGRKLGNYSVSGENATSEISFQFSGLAHGVYHVCVQQGAKLMHKSFVINR